MLMLMATDYDVAENGDDDEDGDGHVLGGAGLALRVRVMMHMSFLKKTAVPHKTSTNLGSKPVFKQSWKRWRAAFA